MRSSLPRADGFLMVPHISKNKTCHRGREIFTTVRNRVFQHYRSNSELHQPLILEKPVLPSRPRLCENSKASLRPGYSRLTEYFTRPRHVLSGHLSLSHICAGWVLDPVTHLIMAINEADTGLCLHCLH